MIEDPDFYGLVPGAIGRLHYRKKFSKDVAHKIATSTASSALSAWASYGSMMVNTAGETPEQTFCRIWQDSKKAPDILQQTDYIHVQVGQKESVDAMDALEKSDSFGGWLNVELALAVRSSVTSHGLD